MANIKNIKYDSGADTEKHIKIVREFMGQMILVLYERGNAHDASKLEDPEKAIFDEFTPFLIDSKYMSDEYKETLKKMGPGLKHHYENNSHHPEHFPETNADEFVSIMTYVQMLRHKHPQDPAIFWLTEYAQAKRSRVGNMSLLDIIEMLADWKAATLRHRNGDIMQSLLINKQRFAISEQLFEILVNTVIELGWGKA